MVVIDELAQVARNKTGAYKAIKTLTDTATWVWGMTGTPTPNEPTDAYHQIELVRPEVNWRELRYIPRHGDAESHAV